MPRVSIHKLLLSLNELTWIAKTVSRKAELATKIEKDKKLKEVVIKFSEKLAKLPDPESDGMYILPTTRHEIRYLEQLVANSHAAYVATVVPGYEEKMKTDTEYFGPYYRTALEVSGMLASLLNKIKKAISNTDYRR